MGMHVVLFESMFDMQRRPDADAWAESEGCDGETRPEFSRRGI
jgi:hypothetical protein